ncbi:MAG TPA: hypothetical protein VGH74_22755, partial [Planctomycetaceae bacterium]
SSSTAQNRPPSCIFNFNGGPVERIAPWQLGSLVPKFLVLAFLTDAALRLFSMFSIDAFTLRAWEAVTCYREQGAPFEANKRYHNDRASGDLPAIGNLPQFRQFHEETFTTDVLGYRNPPNLLGSHRPDVLLVGSSFSAGCSLNDDETLSAQLTARTGQTVYNGATTDLGASEFRRLAKLIGMQRGLVICEVVERFNPPSTTVEKKGRLWQLEDRLRLISPALVKLVVRLNKRVSPLQILAQRGYKRLQNGVLLPNIYTRNLAVRRLRNGEEMLFLTRIDDIIRGERNAERTVDYFSHVARGLQNDGLTLLVVLVPEKLTVYEPLLVDPSPRIAEGPGYLGQVEAGLKENGVATVNLTATLRKSADQDLSEGLYIYWRDDSHWNARGVALAAAEICRKYDPSDWPNCVDRP